MKLVLIGIPGAGKSTQGNLLSKQLDIPYLSTGHIFRDLAKEKTQMGRYVKELINSGALIPDDKVIPIVNSYLKRREYKKGYILDGFPRTVEQSKQFTNHVDKVIYLKVPDKEALWRLAYRNEERNDNTVAAVAKRIEVFHNVTKPVIEFYKNDGRLIVIDGTQSIEEINDELLGQLGKKIVENKVKAFKRKQKVILVLTGLPGAGKSEASEYFSIKKIPVISLGKILNDFVDKNKLEHNEENHKKVREELRAKYGKEAFTILNEENIRKALEKNIIAVVEGMRSWEEYLFLKKKFSKAKIVILTMYASKEIRYKRLNDRKYRKGLGGEERDINELVGANMGNTIAFCDYLVDNNGLVEDLRDKLENIYREIYFS
jgi:adenylate kinase